MKHTLTDDFFRTIDSDEKAYWLGFLYADGYVASKAPWTTICQIADHTHLEKLRTALNYSGPITRPTQSGGYANSSPMSRLTICRKQICTDLASHGCVTHGKQIIVPSGHESAYWRGIFDGDGCISFSSQTQTIGTVTYGPYTKATAYIILQQKDVSSFVDTLAMLGITPSLQTSKCPEMIYIKISAIDSILRFGDWLYSSDGPWLERKKHKFEYLRSLQ